MPILEANSESFLDYFKSLQKGKGTVYQGLPRSAPYQATEDETQQVQAKTPEDVVVQSPQHDESDAPEDNTASVSAKADVWGNHSLMPIDKSSADPSSHQRNTENINMSEPQSATEEKPAASGIKGKNLISSTNPPPSSHHSELQVTTRSMTTTGNNTQATTEASAATEVPATSRMPSPAPSLPPVNEESGKPTSLLSDGAAFLKALPNAAKIFQPSVRGGQTSEASSPPTVDSNSHFPSTNDEKEKSKDGGKAAGLPPIQTNGHTENLPTLSSASIAPTPSQQQQQQQLSPQHSANPWAIKSNNPMSSTLNPSSDSAHPWSATLHRARAEDSTDPWPVKPFNSAAYGEDDPIPPSASAWAVNPGFQPKKGKRMALKPLQYSEEDLLDIGKGCRKALFDRLVEMEGKGKVEVGILAGG
ncbi:MAG: hypothetical protein Q9216_004166 [Gyalolechia sp. 2 TL-2023]